MVGGGSGRVSIPLVVVVLLAAAAAAAWSLSAWWSAPPAPPQGGCGIVVDKARNRLCLYVDGQPARSYPVATGREVDLTPEGRFRVAAKLKDPHGGPQAESRLGSRWLGLATPGHGDGSRYGIHGTDEPESIGRHASAGCIRMGRADVEELYDLVAVGTPVEVRRGPAVIWWLHRWWDERVSPGPGGPGRNSRRRG